MKNKIHHRYCQYSIALLVVLLVGSLATRSGAQSIDRPRNLPADAQADPGPRTSQAAMQSSQSPTRMQSLTAAKKTYEERIDVLLRTERDLYQQQSKLGVSQESFGEIMKALQTQRIDLMVDLAGLDAKQITLLDAQKKETDQVAKSIIVPLAKMLELNMRVYELTKQSFDNGNVGESEVAKARLKLHAAELQLAQAKQATAETGVAADLLSTSIATAEKRARLEKTDELLKSITKSREIVQKGVSTQQEIDELTKRLRGIEAALQVATVQSVVPSTKLELSNE